MLSLVPDETKHIHLQWFGGKDESGDSANADQSAGGTPADEAGDSRGDASVSDASAKGDGKSAQGVSAEEYAKVKAEYERILGVFKEKEAKEKRQRDEALRKQGEFEKLYADATKELESTKPRLERMSATVQALLDAELQGLPPDFDKSLLPAGDPDLQLAWITKAKKAGLLSVTPAAKKPGDGTPPQKGAADQGLLSIYKQ